MKNKVVGADAGLPILGTYEGECADSTITNLNGMDITREVFETVFASDDYKKAIKLGWYIGYLGHPEDPNCMDFQHGCIVMREGHIDDNGKVYGKFDLIDTPVGRTVKAFQDAGVTFGISIRGAGDVVGNSVDPDTFVFRGFDLVTFPAFPDSIPTFQNIAASTDLEARKKYLNVCNAIKDNASAITSATVISDIQAQFSKNSEPYAILECRKAELQKEPETEEDTLSLDELEAINGEKIEAMTKLYRNEFMARKKIESAYNKLKADYDQNCKDFERRLKATKVICSTQMKDFESSYDNQVKQLESDLNQSRKSNLKYKQRVEASDATIRQKDEIIAGLKIKVSETVSKVESTKSAVSHLEAENKELRQRITASQNTVEQYKAQLRSVKEANEAEVASLKSQITAANKTASDFRDGYTKLYAAAVGINPNQVTISSNSSITDVQKIVGSKSAIPATDDDIRDIIDINVDDSDDSLVTM